MPNRIIREGILTSEAVNSLGWAEEVFYRRLLNVVDDFGRYYAQPKLIRAACYPLHIDKVSDSDIGKWISACETAALVRVYPASDGKRYLEVQRFGQHVRAKDSKYPPPPADADHLHSTCSADAVHVRANAPLDGFVFGDVSVGGDGGENARATRRPKRATPLPPDFALDEQDLAYAIERKVNPQSELEGFINHHQAKGSAFKDWKAAWRGWVGHAVGFGRAGGAKLNGKHHGPPAGSAEQSRAAFSRALNQPAGQHEIFSGDAERVD